MQDHLFKWLFIECMNRCEFASTTHLVEVGIGTAGQEAVQLFKMPVRVQPLHRKLLAMYLHEEKQIRILALGSGADPLLDVVGGDVDTLECCQQAARHRQRRRAHHLDGWPNMVFGAVV